MAKSAIQALGNNPPTHQWPPREWKVFEAVCIEELQPDAIELEAARIGVICHSNKLTTQVRLAMEVLMRSYPPRIIIATTTLGQGVNVGISSIIIATPYIGRNTTIDKRDFWNICGRAGRAFVDGEGKILYAIDDTRSPKQIKKDDSLAQDYFDTNSSERVESSLLFIINELRKVAAQVNVSFDMLIELVANNDFSALGEQGKQFEWVLDLIDDGLLALHEDSSVNNLIDDSVEWVDQAFREALAAIQAREELIESNTDDVILFLQARTTSTLNRVPNRSARKAIISSGLPLSVAIKASEDSDFFRSLVDDYINSDMTLPYLVSIVRDIELWTRPNAFSVTGEMHEETKLDNLRDAWLGGTGLRVLIEKEPKASEICKEFYGYQLPWIIHAISHILDKEAEEERIMILSQIALLVEIGVPSEMAAKIFLAGIRSRNASTELANLDMQFGSSIISVRNKLRDPAIIKELVPQVSPSTAEWLNLLLSDRSRRRPSIPSFSRFRLQQSIEENTIYARTFGEEVFLCTLAGKKIVSVRPSDKMPFDQVADDPGFAFTQDNNIWGLDIRDPKYEH